MTVHTSYIEDALAAGADGYLMKGCGREKLLKAIRGLVGAGGTQYFRFKALKAGKTGMAVTYKRAWETGFAEQKVFNVDIK